MTIAWRAAWLASFLLSIPFVALTGVVVVVPALAILTVRGLDASAAFLVATLAPACWLTEWLGDRAGVA